MYQVAVYLHILAAIIWVGGLLTMAAVLVPASRRMESAQRSQLLTAVGHRLRIVGWSCVVVLVVTGTIVSAYRGVTLEAIASGALFSNSFGTLLSIKLAFVTTMIVLTAVHDVMSARASRAGAPGSPEQTAATKQIRRTTMLTARLSTLIALIVVALAVLLVRGLPS